MLPVVRVWRALIRLLITRRTRVPGVERLARAMLFVPLFGSVLVVLRAWSYWFGPVRVEAETRGGQRFQCCLPDLIQMYLYLFGVWEPDITAYIRRYLRPGDLFVDVGANIGFDTIVAAHAVGPTGAVVAIEPSPSTFDLLLETLRMNGNPSNVRLRNDAAAAVRGTVTFFTGPQYNTGLASTVPRAGMRRATTVTAMPIDELLDDEELRRARLVKIDIEGSEDLALAGCCRLITEGRRDLEFLVELSPRWWSDKTKRPIDVLEPYLSTGFHVYEVPNNYWPWRYLWPADVQSPRRSHRDLTRRVRRMDVVLSRTDADAL